MFCRVFKAKIYVNPNTETTHCVTTTTVKDGIHYATKRTVKLLMAFSEKIKLVSSDWINACLMNQELVDIEEYLVRGIVLANKFIKFKNVEINDQIFRNIHFCVEPKDNEAITYKKVIKLIENCGGIISEPESNVIYVSMTEIPNENYKSRVVTYRYILDSLSFQMILRIESYLLN